MPTSVVNVKSSTFDVYIGRAMPRQGLRASPFANPYRIGPDGTREEVIAKYRTYLQSRPNLLARVSTLRDQRLGCWCAPSACHGDVLAALADQS